MKSPRTYVHRKIRITVMPGVFHPGLFFSTRVLIEFLEGLDLRNKRLLELGAGSGLISIFCAQEKGATVTASDINPVALKSLEVNAKVNNVSINILESDLFHRLRVDDFDFIIINPPYYPKEPTNLEEHAWFCGEEFDYFKKLFIHLRLSDLSSIMVYMILSEDCKIGTIETLAKEKDLRMDVVYQKTMSGEVNYVFRISS
ncbi:MAG: methyltransferase [Cyclobacteriaceae bacterium]